MNLQQQRNTAWSFSLLRNKRLKQKTLVNQRIMKQQQRFVAQKPNATGLKLPLFMKLSLFLLFIAVFQLQASNGYAQKTKISINLSNATVEQVLDRIEQYSDFVFLYNDKTINRYRKLSINITDKEISQILPEIFAGTNVHYVIVGKQIVLKTDQVAQTAPTKVKGTVRDSKGDPLIGVNVLIKGTTVGVITDLDGNFTLDVPEGQNEIVLSYIGFKQQEIRLTNKSAALQIQMQEDSQVLSEVVVTAMGIERKAESLTYATQQVGGKELTRAKDVNFINSLQGKSAGLTITPNSSGAGGGSSKIILRGQSSILGNNQPLIVLDGIPLSNGMSSQSSEVLMGTARDGGDLLSTINPDDIANISILKGPNAAALYGSAANNGVIIITTKGGREGKIRIDVSSNTTFETPLVYPKQQTTFAPVIKGTTIEYNGWGDPTANLTDDQLAMFPYLTRNPRNNVTDFYKTGQTYNNSIALNGGTEHSSTYFSYGNTIQKGLMDNNKFARHNLLFKESYNMFNGKLKLDFSLNYVTQKTDNRPIIGKSKGSLPGLYLTPSAVDLRYFDKNRTYIADASDKLVNKTPENDYANPHLAGQSVQNFPWVNNAYINNPYFMLDAMSDEEKRDRIMASFSVKYEIINGLTAQARASVDKTTTENTVVELATIRGANNQSLGATYWGSRGSHREIYSDYLLTYNKEIKNITVNATAGASFKRIEDHSIYLSKTNDTTYVSPNIPYPIESANGSNKEGFQGTLLNGQDLTPSTNWETAVFATAQVGFWGKGYVDVSFRNDWSKAFQQFAAKGKYKSFPYYSVGGNLLLKELLPFELPKMNSMKLRASYSVVGNSIPAEFYSAQYMNPLTGAIAARNPTFDNPKPETTKAIEVGLDGAFFDNKLDFDLTLYQSTMENQFMRMTTASGQSKPINSGKIRNRGIEFSSNYRMRFGENFRWVTGINLSYNENEILETYKPVDGSSNDYVVNASGVEIQTKFIKGGSYGDLYGKDYVYDNDGKIKILNGKPVLTGEYERYIGNSNAKFNFGWNNTFTFKDFSLYVLLDGKVGGKVISLTEAEMDFAGLSERSAQARLENGGMVTLPDGQQVTARNYYETVGGAHMDCVYSATSVRLREISLGYTFFDLLGVSKNLTLSLVARNLGFIYKDSPVDPDISATAANTFGGVDAFTLPTTRSFGLNIKLSF